MRKKLKNAVFPHPGNDHKPHLFRKRAIISVLALVVLLEAGMFVGSDMLPKMGFQTAAVLPSVVTLLTNNARNQESLPQLTPNATLDKAAQSKAEDMASKGYFAHQSPDGSQPWDWIARAGYRYTYAGENLAVNFTDSEELVKAWQNSPTHNMNLMGPRYTEIGVGIATGIYKGQEAVFVVQMFASPQQIASAPIVTQAAEITEYVPVSGSEELAQEKPETILPTEAISDQPVLGAETTNQYEPSRFERLIASSRTYGTYSLATIAFLFILILLIGWGRHHHHALINGTLVVCLIAGMIYFNKNLIFAKLNIGAEGQNTAVLVGAE